MFIAYNLCIYFGFVEVVFCYLDQAGLEHMILLIRLSETGVTGTGHHTQL